jgi:DNA integrity scanning protein DisA with diadenylate cyclase activity
MNASTDITREILGQSLEMALRLKARAVLVYADIFPGIDEIEAYLRDEKSQSVLLITRNRDTYESIKEMGFEVILVPGLNLSRIGQIKIAVLLGLSKNILQRGDRLLCLTGVAEKRNLDTIIFLEVGEEYEMFSGGRLEEIGPSINPEVFERVLDIAVALGSEGREGRPVGTTFVIGDSEEVLRLGTPMVLNPFKGHPEEERNILDHGLTETVKEFSTIDGAFIIRGDGLIEAAGVYLKPDVPGVKLPWGLGTRHASAAGITASTKAIAITVSASTGNVTVFRDGRIFTEVERLRSLAPRPRRDAGQPNP